MRTVSAAAALDGPAVVTGALGKTYSSGVVALAGVELRLERASLTAVIGENGSGKSTLLELVAGLAAPTTGTLEVLGVREAARSTELRRRVGYVAQTPELDPEMTGLETLALFARLHGLSAAARRARLEELVRSFELTEYAGRPISTYSGGMRQRLHLAVGLVHAPELVLLDEPTQALDPAGRRWFWSRLEAERARGTTLVVVTHDLGEIAERCDRVVLLHRGRLLASAPVRELVESHARFEIEIELAGAEEARQLTARLTDLPGIERADSRERGVVATLARGAADPATLAERRVLELLAELGLSVRAFRKRPADLASAYFNLTGRTLEPGPRARGLGRVAGSKRVGA